MSDGIRQFPSKGWNARYVGPDGKRHSKTFTHKEDARFWRTRELRLIDQDEWTPPSSRKPKPTVDGPTLTAWVDQCITARTTRSRRPIKDTTADNYRKLARLAIAPTALGAMAVKDVTTDDLEAWRDALPTTSRTQNGKAYELLVSVFSDAVHKKMIPASPATLRGAGTPEREREPQTMTAQEVNAYLNAADPQWRVALLLSVTCALRIGETLALRERDLDLKTGQIHIRQTVAKINNGDGTHRVVVQTPKTKSSQRTVHLLPHTIDEIRAWHSAQPKRGKDALLFGDEQGRPINDHRLRRAHKKAADAIGRPELHHHDLRATAATMSAEAGATVREIQDQLGHTTPQMALRYQTASSLRDAERARRVSAAWDDMD